MDLQDIALMFLRKNDRNEDSDMRKFLEEKANFKERQSEDYIGYYCGYHETICETNDERDFEEDDKYSLEFCRDKENYSYVYRIGVFSMFDANKSDFGEFHIAFQSDKGGEMIYMGKVNFEDGENMDITQTIKRIAFSMLKCWN